MNALPRLHPSKLAGKQHSLCKAVTPRRAFSSRAAGSIAGLDSILKVSEEVRDAVATNKPVVALESTIYTHGAIGDLGLEDIVRRNGAVPAVCGILAGVPTVGLTPEEIDRMVHGKARKVSRRDMSSIVGKGLMGFEEHGGTTISGTMILARLAGIRVFGTGGLGGVHRGAESSMDVSADLTELGRTRVAVVASGCKGFLDIAKTLEYLETQGVNVSTFVRGRPADKISFPGFWATESGLKSPSTVSSEEEAAAMILAQEKLGIETGIVFANPIPEKDSIPKSEMDDIIEQAVAESARQAASGSENTPFILKRIRELSDGRSVVANTALVQSNVGCAAKIAVALARMMSSKAATPQFNYTIQSAASLPSRRQLLSQADILVAGSVAVDLTCDYKGDAAGVSSSPHLHTSNPASVAQSIGGVGRNVALAAHRVSSGSGVRFCSMIGEDMAGESVMTSLTSLGMDVSCIQTLKETTHPSGRTAKYIAVNGADKDLFLAMADMDIFSSNAFPEDWAAIVTQSKPKWLVVDANWGPSGIASWVKAGGKNAVKVAFEPVSQAKSAHLFSKVEGASDLGVFPQPSIHLSTPNHYEMASMHDAAVRGGYLKDSRWMSIRDDLDQSELGLRLSSLAGAHDLDIGALQQSVDLLPYIPTLITKLGSKGAMLTQLLPDGDPRLSDVSAAPFVIACSGRSHVGGIYVRYYPVAERVRDVVSVNGVGDTFLGVLISGLASGGRVEDLIDVAQRGAVMTLRSPESVSPGLGALRNHVQAAARVKT